MTNVLYGCGHTQENQYYSSSRKERVAWIEWKYSVGLVGSRRMCFECYKESKRSKK